MAGGPQTPAEKQRYRERIAQLRADPVWEARRRRYFDDVEGRMVAQISPEPNSGCWLWTGTATPGGYPKIMVGGITKLAHRVAYELWCGPIPSSLQIDHLCRMRCCVNPVHLDPVTAAENVRRAGALAAGVCRRGHRMAGDNLVTNGRGQRLCLTCRREREQRHRSKGES